MTRYLFSLLLLIAVALSGTMPHAAMAGQTQTMSMPCHTEQTVMSGHSEKMHCGASDHAMTDGCASACIGSMAAVFPSSDVAPMAFRPLPRQITISLVLPGRLIETADRPPKSI
ncbi:hypothetical protein [Yoonia sp. MH D7]